MPQDGDPGAGRGEVALDVFLEDGDQLLLEPIGGSLLILGVSTQVRGNGLDQIVGEGECGLGNEDREGLGELFQGPDGILSAQNQTKQRPAGFEVGEGECGKSLHLQ